MNYCSNCGFKCGKAANFCANCGMSLTGASQQGSIINNNANIGSGSNSLLGTLVTVQLINGMTKNLYENNGNYYTDKACKHQYNPAMIMGIMGNSTDNTIDTMTLMGKEVSMQTAIKNSMAKRFMEHSNRNSRFRK